MIEKNKFLLFKSKKIKDHIKLYIDADLRNLDGTWCFFCNKKLKKNDKKFLDWPVVIGNKDFERFKFTANNEFNFEFGNNEVMPRFVYCCNKCKKRSIR